MQEKTLVMGMDYEIRKLDFGSSVADGVIISGADGVATICINSRVCPERQRKALEHEMRHLMRDDLYSDKPVEIIEREVDDEAS